MRWCFLALLAAGCDDRPLGIQSIDFHLAPVVPTAVPDGLADSDVMALALGTAEVSVTPLDDSGMVMTSALPTLPEDYVYGVRLGLVDDPLARLEPGSVFTLTWVAAPPLQLGTGGGMNTFTSDDVGAGLDAVRGAAVSIVPAKDPTPADYDAGTIFTGEAVLAPTTTSGGGHVHGV